MARDKGRAAGILIIVENLPVPLDRRVWQEATALVRAGYPVSVICPTGHGYDAAYEERDGVHIYRHGLPLEARGALGFVLEYGWALAAESRLAWRVWRERGFAVIQACNPPDDIFAIGVVFRALFGTRFVFDHHDAFADLFALKFPRLTALTWLPRLAERLSLRLADHVITTSVGLQRLAVERHGVAADKVSIARSGLDLKRVPQVEPDPALKRGRRFLALYIGIMGKQDGLDLLLQAAAYLVHGLGRTDIGFVLAGGGPEMPVLQELCHSLNLQDHVEFTGYLTGAEFYRLLASADIGLCPDPKNGFNDKLSMNKVLEYMAFSLPIVQFDLDEGRLLAGEAAVYATGNDPERFAALVAELLDDPERRAAMGRLGRARLLEHFAWERQERIYLDVYRDLIGAPVAQPAEAV